MAVASNSPSTVRHYFEAASGSEPYPLEHDNQRLSSQAGLLGHHRSQPGLNFPFPLSPVQGNWSSDTSALNLSSPVTDAVDDPSLAVDQVPDLMNDHRHWQAPHTQYQHSNTSRGLDSVPAHQRNSSLSTLASAGPASPYAQNTPNPRIAITDPTSDEFSDAFQDADPSIYGVKDPVILYGQYPGATSADNLRRQPHTFHRPSPKLLQPNGGGDLRFPPSSNPVSVASSLASDSPGTPSIDERHHSRPAPAHQIIPKLDRTMTDIYSDELFNPSFSITSAVSPSAAPSTTLSTTSDIFSQRIRAANSQRYGTHSPGTTISEERSPFRHGSPLAPVPHQDTLIQSPMPTSTHIYPTHSESSCQDSTSMHYTAQPPESDPATTISPKDSMLEIRDPGDAASFPLFPPNGDSPHYVAHQPTPTTQVSMASEGSMHNFIPSSLANNFSYSLRNGSHHLSQDNQPEQAHSTPIELPLSLVKPSQSSTGSGTFSCTYQGCPSRFETAALLQKHKREGHRQIHGMGAGRREASLLAGSLSTQNGPHKCLQTNPSTGKPCNTEFSRPYDLTRHEDTIHNPKKRKVTCPICTDKKQFSRGDALSRHYRVCHPELTPPGKRRREPDR